MVTDLLMLFCYSFISFVLRILYCTVLFVYLAFGAIMLINTCHVIGYSLCYVCLEYYCKRFLFSWYGHGIGKMPWRIKSLAFPPVSEFANCRQKGHPGYKNSAPTLRLWCDVFLMRLVQAGETAGLNIAGPVSSLCEWLGFLSCLCCIGVMSDPH